MWSINWSANTFLNLTPRMSTSYWFYIKSNCLLCSWKLKNIFIFQDLSSSSFITSKAGNNKMRCQVDNLSQVLDHVGSAPPIRPQTSQKGEVEVARIKWKLLLMTFAQTFLKFPHFLKKEGSDGPISNKFLSELRLGQ